MDSYFFLHFFCMKTNECVQLRRSKRKREVDSPISIKKNTKSIRIDGDQATSSTNKSEKKNTMKNSKLKLKEKLKNDAPNKEFLVNEVVFATIPGYSPWPARILSINDHTIFVEFFGTSQM